MVLFVRLRDSIKAGCRGFKPPEAGPPVLNGGLTLEKRLAVHYDE